MNISLNLSSDSSSLPLGAGGGRGVSGLVADSAGGQGGGGGGGGDVEYPGLSCYWAKTIELKIDFCFLYKIPTLPNIRILPFSILNNTK